MKSLHIIFCGLILSGLSLTSALADTMYTYTGNPFTGGYGPAPGGLPQLPFTTSDSVSGWFTVSTPLGHNLLLTPITPSGFSFTDDVTTFTNKDVLGIATFSIATDANGAISNWAIELLDPDGVTGLETDDECISIYSCQSIEDFGEIGPFDAFFEADVFGHQGTWTSSMTTPSTVTPEPRSIVLLGFGALGLVGIILRRLSPGILG
jgi:hypothetical protein